MIPFLPTTYLTNVTRARQIVAAQPTSPFTGTTQVQLLGGEWWEFEFEFDLMGPVAGAQMSGFLAGLQGPAGSFLFVDPLAADAYVAGDPRVRGGSQSGRSLNTDGWNPSQTVLTAGQVISIGTDVDTRMYQLTADAASDATGRATLSIWPALRVSPADNAALIVDNPAVRLRLAGPVPERIAAHGQYRFSISAREVV